MRETIEARLRQMQQERAQLAAQMEQGRLNLAAYDGAIAVLQQLLAEGDAPAAEQAQAD